VNGVKTLNRKKGTRDESQKKTRSEGKHKRRQSQGNTTKYVAVVVERNVAVGLNEKKKEEGFVCVGAPSFSCVCFFMSLQARCTLQTRKEHPEEVFFAFLIKQRGVH
jgi:hypothetical protein